MMHVREEFHEPSDIYIEACLQTLSTHYYLQSIDSRDFNKEGCQIELDILNGVTLELVKTVKTPAKLKFLTD